MKFYANPYNIGATGFYFESNDEFLDKSAALRDNCGNSVEEFERRVTALAAEHDAMKEDDGAPNMALKLKPGMARS